MLKIRLRRMGSRHRPFYRFVVSDSRQVPTATAIDEVGIYNPILRPAEIRVDFAKIEHWLARGTTREATSLRLGIWCRGLEQGDVCRSDLRLVQFTLNHVPQARGQCFVESALDSAGFACQAFREAQGPGCQMLTEEFRFSLTCLVEMLLVPIDHRDRFAERHHTHKFEFGRNMVRPLVCLGRDPYAKCPVESGNVAHFLGLGENDPRRVLSFIRRALG